MSYDEYPYPTFIKSVPQLHVVLQDAIELEHATIPTYLCALYSIQDGTNREAAQVIQSVVIEEMLHLTLAANVLNAIGGRPSINGRRFVPDYPTELPIVGRFQDPPLIVPLQKFSPDAIEVFVRIEQPDPPYERPNPEDPETIGEFYLAIENALKNFSHEMGEREFFCGDPALQIQPGTYYYGGGGKVIAVYCLDDALRALEEIVEQGEGFHHTKWAGNAANFGQEPELAHFYRFNEIKYQRYYTAGDSPDGPPTGEPLEVDYDAVYNMRPNPKTYDLEPGSELWQKSVEFSECYMRLLQQLHDAFNGDQELLVQAVGQMYELKYKAQALMKIPFSNTGETAGPTFEYYPPEES